MALQRKSIESVAVLLATFFMVALNLFPSGSSMFGIQLYAGNEIVFDRAANTSRTTLLECIASSRSMKKESSRTIFTNLTTTDYSEFMKQSHQSLLAAPSTRAWKNLTTYCYAKRNLISGYRNQIMALTMLMMKANEEGHGQFLLNSLHHKDTYGTNQFVPFEYYFDVDKWNSYFDAAAYVPSDNINDRNSHPISLPRLVYHDPNLHHQWDVQSNSYKPEVINGTQDPTHPYGYSYPSTRLNLAYQRYVKGSGKYVPRPRDQRNKNKTNNCRDNRNIFAQSKRNPAEILMLQGALRPNPVLQDILESLLQNMKNQSSASSVTKEKLTAFDNDWSYMTLHARVEPDMQRHPVCRDKKVLYLREIVAMIESQYKYPQHPPVDAVFLPINRQYLEKEGTLPKQHYKSTGSDKARDDAINWIAVGNLKELNRITKEGMWNGTVPVLEFGANALRGTVYEYRPSTAGAILNFFLALQPQCRIFVGTEVSSFSHDVLASRFFRGYDHYRQSAQGSTSKYENYKYLPDGLFDWISPDMVDPPGFMC